MRKFLLPVLSLILAMIVSACNAVESDEIQVLAGGPQLQQSQPDLLNSVSVNCDVMKEETADMAKDVNDISFNFETRTVLLNSG